MIIGKGDLAQVLKNTLRAADDNFIFFASGVSNSQEINEWEYRREKILLLDQNKTKHLVYFSSLSVFYSDTRYAQHKKQMEQLVKKYFKDHTIIRLGNISWGKNPHTLINHFKNQINNGEALVIQDTYRYITDKQEFLHWIEMIPKWNCEINIPGRMLKVTQIVEEIKNGYIG